MGKYTLDEHRKYAQGIGLVNDWQWLSTPNQTTSRGDTSYVRVVGDDGRVGCNGCDWDSYGVRPFFFLKSSILVSLKKLES